MDCQFDLSHSPPPPPSPLLNQLGKWVYSNTLYLVSNDLMSAVLLTIMSPLTDTRKDAVMRRWRNLNIVLANKNASLLRPARAGHLGGSAGWLEFSNFDINVIQHSQGSYYKTSFNNKLSLSTWSCDGALHWQFGEQRSLKPPINDDGVSTQTGSMKAEYKSGHFQ